MHRLIPISLALLVTLAAVQPLAAGAATAGEIERMTAQFERFFQPMIGAIDARDLTFRDLGNGFFSLSYALDAPRRTSLRAKATDDGPFRTLACGHMASEPANPATMVNSVISDLETEYNFWWTLVNMGEEEELRKTTVRIMGPGEFEIEASEDEVPYGPNAVHLIWFNPETALPETGIYTHRVAVKGAGKVVYRFFAEEASTTTLER